MATNSTLTPFQVNVIIVVRVTTSSLSFLGSFFIIFSIVTFRKWKQMSTRLILYLSLSSLGEATANLLTIFIYNKETEPVYDGVCFAQGMMLQFFQVAEFLWTTVIALNLCFVVVLHKRVRSFEKWYHIIVWSIVLIFAILPATTTSYGLGEQNYWCWITKDKVIGDVWRFIIFYIPLYLCIMLVIILYIIIWRTVYKTFKIFNRTFIKNNPSLGDSLLDEDSIHSKDNQEKERQHHLLNKLKAYPIIFLCMWIFPTINRIQNWIENTDIFALVLLQVLTAPLIGFVNSVVYGWTLEIRSRYRAMLSQTWCCKKCIKPKPMAKENSSEEEEEITVNLE